MKLLPTLLAVPQFCLTKTVDSNRTNQLQATANGELLNMDAHSTALYLGQLLLFIECGAGACSRCQVRKVGVLLFLASSWWVRCYYICVWWFTAHISAPPCNTHRRSQPLAMCDSEISESCPTDFSSYCPVNVPRPRLERKKVKTQSRVRKRVVLFSRKGTQYSKSRLSYSSQPSLVPEGEVFRCS